MNIFLDDRRCRENLYPFTQTRHVADIRVGILTIREKWELLAEKKIITSVAELEGGELPIHADIIPTLQNFQSVMRTSGEKISILENNEIKILHHPWQIFQYNDWAIRHDFALVTEGKISQPISATNRCINEQQIFIEEGAEVEHCIINAATGPVYIGKSAIVMEGSMIRGPFSIGEQSVVKMGTKIYGAVSVGPGCTIGGEIKNAVFFEYSNKAHDGYLGDSVIGAWCNLGAGTSNSNVKNTGGEVKFMLGKYHSSISAGNKAGLLMGDYSRAGINTSFNTGTVVGVCCNIFSQQFPPKFIENFSWGSERYIFEKAIRDIENWKKMKLQSLSEKEYETLYHLYTSNQ
ncbi:MAG: glucose-1-phosphate thymidylyltransferase [Bacteroidetes bacterium]|nr:glucose-1-phosphate thymidylyltransferase [Bacteroidota bacterium]